MGTGLRRRSAWRAIAAAVLLAPFFGCTFLLPSEESRETRFESFVAARDSFEAIVPGATGASELRDLGIDPAELGTQVLPYTSIVRYFLVHRGVGPEFLDPAVVDCFRARQVCQVWYVEASRDKGRRNTAWLLDALRFHRRKKRSGYWFEGIVLVQNEVATYRLYRGRPRYSATEEQIRPLGPLQSGPNVEIEPLAEAPRELVIGEIREQDVVLAVNLIESILQKEGLLDREFRGVELESRLETR